MDTSTGQLYDTPQAALDAGVKRDDLIELIGTRRQAEQVSRATRLGIRELERRAARKHQQKASRHRNR